MYNVPVQRIRTRYRYGVHEKSGKDDRCVSE